MSVVKDRLRTLLRSAKNSLKDYNAAERRVRAATSNEPWPPSSRMMMAVCHDMTDPSLYDSVLIMLLKRLKDKSQVMHVRKALQLVEFCLRHGSKRFVDDMKARRYVFKDLLSYRFLVHGQDKGAEIRTKAERIMDLLADNQRLEQERITAQRARSRIHGISSSTVVRRSSSVRLGNRYNADVSSPSHGKVASPKQAHSLTSPSSRSSEPTTSSSDDSVVPMAIEAPRKKDQPMMKSGGSGPAALAKFMEPAAASPFDPLSALFDAEPVTWTHNENDEGNRTDCLFMDWEAPPQAIPQDRPVFAPIPPERLAPKQPMAIEPQQQQFLMPLQPQKQASAPMPDSRRWMQQPMPPFGYLPQQTGQQEPFLALPDPNNPFL